LFPKTFKLCGVPNFWLWAFLNVISETPLAHFIRN
jgi:hypothetical protein